MVKFGVIHVKSYLIIVEVKLDSSFGNRVKIHTTCHKAEDLSRMIDFRRLFDGLCNIKKWKGSDAL